ncbi:hypothetical protein BT67DRAFT_440134 [Trichocladium antarcticum]|uniref:Helicase C-terminal domain-containing protein n=1 Tax=Trichocladium antarcticum TaxID=1450529 RepID=A0AAN6UMY5_9PEZI|nr:hypothetical protein BT67DRAFT_440134 [Trichocladium antarcticum]
MASSPNTHHGTYSAVSAANPNLAFLCGPDGDSRASHTSNEREKIVQMFNNPASNLDCLVLNMSLSSAGLNLHKCCRRGLILQYPWNWPTVLQTMGRLFRIGANKVVDWTILHVTSTVYDVMEDRINRKYCEQLQVGSSHPHLYQGTASPTYGSIRDYAADLWSAV